MERNIPLLNLNLHSEDDSDIPFDSSNTTGTPDRFDNELLDGQGIISRETNYQKRYPGQKDDFDETPISSLNSNREADFTVNEVVVFDIRGKSERSVKGNNIFIDASDVLLKQRLATMKDVLQNQLVFLNISENAILQTTYVAILDYSSIDNLTVFLKSDPEKPFSSSYRCINLPKDSGVRFLLDKLNLSQLSWPFFKGQRLHDTSSMFDQGVRSGDDIYICKIRTETFKCLFRNVSKYEQLFSVECLNIDTILEFKQKIRDTIKNLNKICCPISASLLNSHIWLTSGKQIFGDEEYICSKASNIDSSSDSSDNLSTTYYDFVLHFEPPDFIPIIVSYKVGEDRYPTVETVIVPEQSSTANLCDHISKLLHCLPSAVKLIIRGRKLPMSDDLSTFSEFKPGCKVYASVKRAITVTVTMGDESLKFNVMKMDKVESLKCKIADKIKKLPRVLRLEFKGKELVDFRRIEQEDIKDNSTINAKIIEDRIQISIRKSTHPITHFIVENLEETMIRDLKNYYRHFLRLSAKLDIDLYTYDTSSQPDDFATLQAIGAKDKDIFFAIEKQNSECPFEKIFEADYNGYVSMKLGMIKNGVILFSNLDPRTVIEANHKDHIYSLPSTACNIRLAQSFEVEPFQFSFTPEPLLHVQSILPVTPSKAVHLEQHQLTRTMSVNMFGAIPKMFVSSTKRRTNDGPFLNPNTDPPGVISDKELQSLAKELPAYNWQFFIRDLGVPNAVINRHTEAYPKNVAETIYQCLNDWKQCKGIDAKRTIIKETLHVNELVALCEFIFDYKTV